MLAQCKGFLAQKCSAQFDLACSILAGAITFVCVIALLGSCSLQGSLAYE